MKRATWYFDFVSPFAYLHNLSLVEFEEQLLIYRKPLLFAGLLKHWGTKGPRRSNYYGKKSRRMVRYCRLKRFWGYSYVSIIRWYATKSSTCKVFDIMVYLVTQSFNTASWIYYGRREEGGRLFPKNFKKIKTPTGVAVFPSEMSEWPPRSYVDRIFNIKHWTEMTSGGHFAAMEEPDKLVNDIVKFAKAIR